MGAFSKKFYTVSCVIMAVITALALIVTFYVGTTGKAPAQSPGWNGLVLFSLISMGVLTVLCLCVSAVGGKIPYKIGFYILHGGLVVLIVGFVITNLASMKCYGELKTVEDGGSLAPSVDFYEDGVLKNRVDLTYSVGLKSIKTDYYESGQPKHYEATLVLVDRTTRETVKELSLTVNHPVRIDGLKFYLMDAPKDGNSIKILVKDNPGEYIVISGIVILTLGTFIMCFSDGFSIRGLLGLQKKSGEERGADERKKVKKHG